MTLSFFLLNIFLSYVLIFIFLPFFKKNIPDKPNIRSSHTNIKPRGGGIFFVLISVFSSLFFDQLAPLISLPLAIVGLVDDKFGVNEKIRFAFQIVTTISLIFYALPIWNQSGYSFLILTFLILFFILFGTSIINFSNFVDGIDGLLAGNMLITFLSISVLFDPRYFLICGALLGFLKWNWSPAMIFMGDVGSTFLGSILFYAIISSNSFERAFVILFISSPILIDPLVCFIRRSLNSEKVFFAHKKHLYQRLNLAGWSHRKITLTYMLISLLIFLSYLLFGFYYSIGSSVLLSLIAVWLDKKVAVRF